MCAWSGGNFTRANPTWATDASLGIGIEAGRHDAQDNDFTTGIDQCLNKTGQNSMTGDLNLGGYKAVNAAAGTAAAPAICAGNDVNTGMYSPGADTIGFANNGAETVRISSSGNVGIGTGATIAANLHVAAAGTTASQIAHYANDVTGGQLAFTKSRGATVNTNTIVANGDAIGLIRFYGANGTDYTEAARIAAIIDAAPGATNDMPGSLHFSTTANGSGTTLVRMLIDNAGKVGIGTTAPGYTLHVDRGASDGVVAQFGRASGQSAYIYASTSSAYFMSDSSGNTSVELNESNDRVAFWSGGLERMRIDASGYASLGTTGTGNARLQVNSNSTTVPVLDLRTNAAGDVANSAIEIIKTDNNTTSSQNFIRFYINAATGSGRIVANGASAAAFATFSDERLKENIEDLPSQLDNILALRPVEFDYKNGSGHQIGFIAQEVQQIYPDLVGEDGEYLVLADLNKNDARLIKAFQELAAKVEALEARVAELEG